MDQIVYWNREKKKEEIESVYGDALLRWAYQSKLGQTLTESVLSRQWFSQAYGSYNSSILSKRKIEPFIQKFKIDMNEYVNPGFQSFNDFFIRSFKSGVRPFVQDPDTLCAFSEGRYLAYEKITSDLKVPVKGEFLKPEVILGKPQIAKVFENGPMLISRLCPVDYHRFHFPDSGEVETFYQIPGKYHSVNPVALAYKDSIFGINERAVSILNTDHFGRIAYVEVGAMCVGKIVQTHDSKRFKRGDEKGYFLFGGSTVILLGEEGRWTPDSDLLEKTKKGQETLVKLGSGLARSLN